MIIESTIIMLMYAAGDQSGSLNLYILCQALINADVTQILGQTPLKSRFNCGYFCHK